MQHTMKASEQPNGPVGIGGWLLLPIVGLVLSIGWSAYNFYTAWFEVAELFTGEEIFDLNEAYLAYFSSIALEFIVVSWEIFALYQIVKRSPNTPKIMTIYFVGSIIFSIANGWAVNIIEAANAEPLSSYSKYVLGDMIRASIWIPYFRISKRVANTFKSKEKTIAQQIGKVFS